MRRIKVMFVCHGNICRSPMAEFTFRKLVDNEGLSNYIEVASSATSYEEIGNSVHYGTRNRLIKEGISVVGKVAIKLTNKHYAEYDYFVGMDDANIHNMIRILDNDPLDKVSRLMDYTDTPSEVADPWYTGDFDTTYNDVLKGCTQLLEFIVKENNYKV